MEIEDLEISLMYTGLHNTLKVECLEWLSKDEFFEHATVCISEKEILEIVKKKLEAKGE